MINNFFKESKIVEILSGKIAIYPIIPITSITIICVVILLFKRRGLFPFLRQFIMVLLLFLINLRIMIPDANITVSEEKLDAYVLFVVDNTISMLAEDYNGDGRRIDAVKEDCAYIIDELQGAKFAVVSFNNDSQIMTPYSNDQTFTKSIIESIKPLQELYATGTTLNICLGDMEEMLKSASEREDGMVYLFFISDGEITADEELGSFDDVAKYIDDGAVLGYGTSDGGNMHVQNYDDEWELVIDYQNYDNVPAVSSIDETNLKSIAKDTGVNYIHMNEQSKIKDLLSKIKKNTTSEIVKKVESNYYETYYWFALLLAFMLILEFILLKIKK